MLRKQALGSGFLALLRLGCVVALMLTAWTAVSQGASTSPHSDTDLSVTIDWFDDWGAGACGDATVIFALPLGQENYDFPKTI